jgi:hypothetical protein
MTLANLSAVKTQDLLLELIRRSEHNSLPGEKVATDLDNNRHLWRACMITMGQWPCQSAKSIMDDVAAGRKEPYERVGAFCSLIPLRDLSQQDNEFHTDELWIISSGVDDKALELLARKWDADEIDWLPMRESAYLQGGGAAFFGRKQPDDDPNRSSLMRVWWD